ncbi:formate dehydrogenase accessory sulfurtransferase FdhD [Candidatus Aerophobetes bacterium]|uniref:Sulfur carrier protein FdhD n=1 Tax=Aerophobetes bacterium TaxID=2030807 RepID=A0A523T9I4_UNCAE|nr:MAG: formate dehydrogenase accessory sulfurtransferase FdhD [Candidatus Aerophobetes bacterium]
MNQKMKESIIGEDETGKLTVLEVRQGKRKVKLDIAVEEVPLTIFLDGRELVTLLSSPKDLNYLAVGFLYSEGLVKNREEIESLIFEKDKNIIRVKTKKKKKERPDSTRKVKKLIPSGCGTAANISGNLFKIGEYKRLDSKLTISSDEIIELMRKLQHRSRLYRSTGGVHSAALASREDILIFSEDIGRHNAVDKVLGHCILDGIPLDDKVTLTSGRVSSEIVLKVARANIPIIISRSAPTMLGAKLASHLGVTLVGFARGRRMNIYTHEERVT